MGTIIKFVINMEGLDADLDQIQNRLAFTPRARSDLRPKYSLSHVNPFHWTLAAVAAGVEKLSRWRTASISYMAEVPTQEKLVEVRLRIVLTIGPIDSDPLPDGFTFLRNTRHPSALVLETTKDPSYESRCARSP